MSFLIDTSSLDRVAQYFMPFDTNNNLEDFLKEKIKQGHIVILKKVYEEFFRKSKSRQYIKNLNFLKDDNIEIKVHNISKDIIDTTIASNHYSSALAHLWTNLKTLNLERLDIKKLKDYLKKTNEAGNHNVAIDDLDTFIEESIKETKKTFLETERNKYIDNADFHLIFYAKEKKKEEHSIITEESSKQNDGKLYKKIPLICKQENIPCMNIATFLKVELPKINPGKELQLLISNSN